MYLNSTQRLTVRLSGAGTIPVNVTYIKVDQPSDNIRNGINYNRNFVQSTIVNTNGATEVDAVETDPKYFIFVENISVRNNSGGSATAIFKFYSRLTGYDIVNVTLDDGDTLMYDGEWRTINSQGALKTATTGGGAADGGNVIAAGTQTANSTGTVLFSNSNGVSFGMNASSVVTASINALTSQSNQALSGSNGSFTFQTASFGTENGITFYTSGGSMVASHNALTSQSNQALSGSNGSFTFQTATFGNLNGMSFYSSNGSMVGSFSQSVQPEGTQSIGISTGGNTLGTTGMVTGTGIQFVLVGGNNVTLSQSISNGSHGTMTIIGESQSLQPAVGLNTAQTNVTWTVNSSGLSLNAAGYAGTGTAITGALSATLNSGGLSLSIGNYLTTAMQSNAATISNINLSAGTTSNNLSAFVLSNSNNVSFGLNGSTITASANRASMSYFEPYPYINTRATLAQYFMQRINVPLDFAPNIYANLLLVSNSSSAGATISQHIGIYTLNGSTWSLASGTLGSWAYNSTLATSYTDVSGTRLRTYDIGTWNLTPGDYMLGVGLSIGSALTAGSYSYALNRNTAIGVAVGGMFGTANITSPTYFGVVTVAQTTTPASVAITDIAQTVAQAGAQPWWFLAKSL